MNSQSNSNKSSITNKEDEILFAGSLGQNITTVLNNAIGDPDIEICGAYIEGVAFSEKLRLQEAYVEGIEFQTCTFSDCDFRDTQFWNTRFHNCVFINCDFQGCLYNNMPIANTDFTGCLNVNIPFDASKLKNVWNCKF
jgi:uncharacterized protein YjbI with pentapeptide repeats